MDEMDEMKDPEEEVIQQNKNQEKKRKRKEDFQNKKKITKKFRKEKNAKEEEKGAMITKAKKLWEKLRLTELNPKQRESAMKEMMNLIKGRIQEIIFKHDASRIIQTCLKYGNPSQRKEIISELKGKLVTLSKSHYSHFLASKILKYCDEKHVLLKEFYGHFKELLKHKEACPVIEYIWTDVANAQEKSNILLEFYGTEFTLFKPQGKTTLKELLEKNPQKKDSIFKTLEENITSIIDKGAPVIRNSLFHKVLLEFFTNASVKSIQSIIQNLREILVEIIHTKEGALVGVHCVSYGNAKDRKVIVKGMKGYIAKVCTEEFGHLVLLRILDSVDDTIFLSKSLLPELKKELKNLVLDKFGSLALLYILAGKDKKYFTAFTLSLLQPTLVPSEENPSTMVSTSKKADDVRHTELLQFGSDSLLSVCEENVGEMITSKFGCNVFYETFKNAIGDKTKLLSNLTKKILENPNEFLTDFFASRTIKKILKEDSSFDKMLSKELKDKHEWAIKKGSSFIILALLECEETSQAVKTELLPHKKTLKQHESIPGVKEILEKL